MTPDMHIKRIYDTYQFIQMITEVTRVTSDARTLIDHIDSNKPDRISSRGKNGNGPKI